MKKKWMLEEEEYLKTNWDIMSIVDIIENIGRSEDSILRKARRLGLDVRKKAEVLCKRKWTLEEDKFIIRNYKIMTTNKISSCLNRTASSVRKRAQALKISNVVTHWTKEEEEFLFEKWGIISVDAIAKQFNRSRNAVLLKACQMSLREQVTANGTYFTPADISNILNINIRTLYTWMQKGDMRCRKFRVGKKKKYQITIDSFCKFIKNHQDKWDSQSADISLIKSYCASYLICEDGSLLIREESFRWLGEKIMRDKAGYNKLMKPWTTKEEKELLNLIEMGHSHKDISCKLKRSMGSIKTKTYMLKSKENCKYAI